MREPSSDSAPDLDTVKPVCNVLDISIEVKIKRRKLKKTDIGIASVNKERGGTKIL